MNSLIAYLLVLVNIVSVFCYDGYTTCTKPFRGGKSRLDVPCDFSTQSWCTIPGSYYPWRAVRRFVYENHGLMRRMYGEERHISVLRSEIESNDVEYHQTDKWSQQSNLKRYKLRKEEIIKSTNKPLPDDVANTMSSSTTKATTSQATTTPSTTTSTTTTTTATTTTTTASYTTSTAFGNKSTVYEDVTTTSWADVTETTLPSTTLPESEYTTSTDDSNMDITTDYHTPSTTQKSQPQIFQDTLEKSSSTTEKANLFYKSKGVNACPVKEEVVAPFWANSTRGEVLALLNLYPFEQYVHWERCTFENKQMFCREGCRCEQQYRLHRLLAYDPSNDCRGIFSDWFKFPSCCVCRCYDLPNELRLTSRSPRKDDDDQLQKTP